MHAVNLPNKHWRGWAGPKTHWNWNKYFNSSCFGSVHKCKLSFVNKHSRVLSHKPVLISCSLQHHLPYIIHLPNYTSIYTYIHTQSLFHNRDLIDWDIIAFLVCFILFPILLLPLTIYSYPFSRDQLIQLHLLLTPGL